MSESTAKSNAEALCSECQTVLAETATLPALPDVSDVAANAANDTAFSLSGDVTSESIERLMELAESIASRLERIEEALVTAQSPSPQGTKKKSRSKK